MTIQLRDIPKDLIYADEKRGLVGTLMPPYILIYNTDTQRAVDYRMYGMWVSDLVIKAELVSAMDRHVSEYIQDVWKLVEAGQRVKAKLNVSRNILDPQIGMQLAARVQARLDQGMVMLSQYKDGEFAYLLPMAELGKSDGALDISLTQSNPMKHGLLFCMKLYGAAPRIPGEPD